MNCQSQAGSWSVSYLEASGQELVLHLQKVAFVSLRFERLVDDGELGVVLDVLPPGVAVSATQVKDQREFGWECGPPVTQQSKQKEWKSNIDFESDLK